MKRIILIAAAISACMVANAQSFAHVNFNELIQLMPEMDSARVQLDAASKEANETYQAMVEEGQSKYTQFQQKQATWTPSVRESKERELMEIQNRIAEFEQAIQQDLQQLQGTLTAPIYQKAQTVVSDIAKAIGYIYVFDINSVLYFDPAQSTDITAEARKALNIPEGRTLESLQAELQARAQAQQQ